MVIMKKLHFSVLIQAPKEQVWDVMLNDKSYREWTSAFMEGSYYEGTWTAGSKMRFLAPEPDGGVSGMLSEIREVRPYDFVSIENLGEIKNDEEILFTQELTGGQAMLENYTFTDKSGITELSVDVDSPHHQSRRSPHLLPQLREAGSLRQDQRICSGC